MKFTFAPKNTATITTRIGENKTAIALEKSNCLSMTSHLQYNLFVFRFVNLMPHAAICSTVLSNASY